jgi:hypothetical protein
MLLKTFKYIKHKAIRNGMRHNRLLQAYYYVNKKYSSVRARRSKLLPLPVLTKPVLSALLHEFHAMLQETSEYMQKAHVSTTMQ